ncbi:hypothetical protein BGX38DRAFT_1269771 [Terfezia claveryi]|nr:hypothetical protein BGX38DRAFT_1269771 [Terfezia claveryi]
MVSKRLTKIPAEIPLRLRDSPNLCVELIITPSSITPSSSSKDPFSLLVRILTMNIGGQNRTLATNGDAIFTVWMDKTTPNANLNGILNSKLQKAHLLDIRGIFEFDQYFHVLTTETGPSTIQTLLAINTIKSSVAVYIFNIVLGAVEYLREHGIEFMPKDTDIILANSSIVIGNWWMGKLIDDTEKRALCVPEWAKFLVTIDNPTFEDIPRLRKALSTHSSVNNVTAHRCLCNVVGGVPWRISKQFLENLC